MCLDKSARKKSKPASKHTVEEQVSADPNQAIPLHYSPLRQPTNTAASQQPASSTNNSGRESPKQVSVITRTTLPEGTWHVLSKTLLMRKAAVCYLALAEVKVNKHEYGTTLKYLRLALTCFCE